MLDLWSRFGGKPQHLFAFWRQQAVFRFAAGTRGRNVEIGDHVYIAEQIERGAIRQTPERAQDKMKIRMPYVVSPTAPAEGWPATQILGDWWRPYIPGSPVRVVCLDYQRGSAEPPRLVWHGWVAGAEYTDAELTLTCDPNAPAGELGNQGAKWQRPCWKVPYSTGPRGCNLDPADFEIEATITAVAGLILQSPAFLGTQYTLAGGELIYSRSIGAVEITESLPIIGHIGNTIHLLHGAPGLTDLVNVIVRPTCQQSWAACAARDNTLNYGGTIYKPARDPIEVSMKWG